MSTRKPHLGCGPPLTASAAGADSRELAIFLQTRGLPRWPSVESARQPGDVGSVLGLGRCPGEANGNPLQYSCLGNAMESGAWRAAGHGVARVGHDLVTQHHHHRQTQGFLFLVNFPESFPVLKSLVCTFPAGINSP